MKRPILTTLFFCFFSNILNAQVSSVDKLEQKYLNWYNRDAGSEGILSTSVDKAYQELLANKPVKKTIIVAVIDSGIDINHEDLKGKIWVNEDEIPHNKIDDDKNGYIDDVYGWNFIGNQSGENIHYENMEYTRLFKSAVPGVDYEKAKVMYTAEVEKRLNEKANIEKFEDVYIKSKSIIKEKTGIDVRSLADLDAISPDDEGQVLRAREFLRSKYAQGFSDQALAQLKEMNKEYFEKFLNLDFNPRSIIGDDPTDIHDNQYGNPDVKGPRSDHGTAVAGVIAAIRNNDLGINGIASDVKIMCIRSTPMGDERDKDVALAIQYAVNNGADIINLSFGKDFSPEKKFVDEAVKLAEQKNVLIVHAAGNKGRDIDTDDSYPSDRYLDKTEASNWLNVGACGMTIDEEAVAIFSNYGVNHVDLFAPGQNIISLDSSSTYNMHDGTSLAAPVVSGIAALILSYHPEIPAKHLIQILMESVYRNDKLKVLMPDLVNKERKKVKFKTLSRSGGVVNAYKALKKAELLNISGRQ